VLGLLERLEAMAGADGRTGSLIELRAVRALALAGADDPAALDALADALALAGPRGYVRIFADEGAPMRTLIGRLVTDGRTGGIGPPGYLRRLLRAFEPSGDSAAEQRAPAGVPGLIDPLSGREIEVLRLLASGRQNREIAEQLVVALSTVKKHVTHIFEKLGATNRTEATARAREFGLIP
jgi:LuxR family maltose regulon positive regulatory protein